MRECESEKREREREREGERKREREGEREERMSLQIKHSLIIIVDRQMRNGAWKKIECTYDDRQSIKVLSIRLKS